MQPNVLKQCQPSRIPLLLALSPSILLHSSSAPPMHNSFSPAFLLLRGQLLLASRPSMVELYSSLRAFKSLEETIPLPQPPSAPMGVSGLPSHSAFCHCLQLQVDHLQLLRQVRTLLILLVREQLRMPGKELVSSSWAGPSSQA